MRLMHRTRRLRLLLKIRRRRPNRLLKDSSLSSIKKLACFYLVLCLSTVWCERGFSLMALIKTKLRNGLGTETLDAFMMITSNGPRIRDRPAVTAFRRGLGA